MPVKRYDGTDWVVVAGDGAAGLPGAAGIVTSATAPGDTSVLWADTTVTTNNALIPAGGTTGQLLSKTSGSDYATQWATVSTGANWSLLNTGGTSLTGASTVTVSGISGADKIFILFAGASAGAYSWFRLRLNTDSGNNYVYAGLRTEPGSTYDGSSLINSWGSATAEGAYFFGAGSSNAATAATGVISINGANSSGIKTINSTVGVTPGGGVLANSVAAGGIYTGTSAITSISLVASVGNWDAGTVYVYTSA